MVLLGFVLKLWSDTNRRLELLEVSLRGEIRGVRDELKGDIAAVRDELKGDIAAVRVELKGDIAAVRDELKGDILVVRNELHSEIGAVRTDISASIERLSGRQHADTNAVNARLDVLLLARGSLAGTPDAAPASGERQPATAAESAPEYQVPPRGTGASDRP